VGATDQLLRPYGQSQIQTVGRYLIAVYHLDISTHFYSILKTIEY
jgi:hypothetical protein